MLLAIELKLLVLHCTSVKRPHEPNEVESTGSECWPTTPDDGRCVRQDSVLVWMADAALHHAC